MWGQAHGGLPLTVAGKEVVECPITGLFKICKNALDTWNKYLSEIWQLITQSPEQFKGGSIWGVIVNIHDAVRAIGLALLVLFFVVASCVPAAALPR